MVGSLLRPADPLASSGAQMRTVFAETTGGDSELLDVLPITRRANRKPGVVMSLGPVDLPRLGRGHTLKAFAEVQTTNTCFNLSERCIGQHYEFSPFVTARLVLARRKSSTGGRHAVSLADPKSVHCSQGRPNRNHHCVLTFQHARKRIPDPQALPCPPRHCFVNLVVSAHNPRARAGDVIVIGADRPNGSIIQDKGRLSVVVTRPTATMPKHASTVRPVRRRIPVTLGDDWTSVYSIKLSNLNRGDVLVALAKQRTSIERVPYSVFVGTRIILTGRRVAPDTNRLSRRVSSLKGQFTEGNGFNCTHGQSAYSSPCTSRKAGLIVIRRTPRRRGSRVPLFVNVVCHTRPKLAPPHSGDHVVVLPHGGLTVNRYTSG